MIKRKSRNSGKTRLTCNRKKEKGKEMEGDIIKVKRLVIYLSKYIYKNEEYRIMDIL